MSQNRKPDGRQSGFTLLEVIVAASVAVIMLTALLRVFGSVWDLTARVREEASAIVVAQSVLETTMQRTTLAAGANAGRSGDYGWSVQIAAVDVPQSERAAPAAAPRTGTSSNAGGATAEDGDASSGDAADQAPEDWNWRLFRIQVAVLAPSGRKTSLETLRLAPSP